MVKAGVSLFLDADVGISDRVFIDVPETHVEVIGEGRLVMGSVAENPRSSSFACIMEKHDFVSVHATASLKH